MCATLSTQCVLIIDQACLRMLILDYNNIQVSRKIALDQSMTFNKLLQEQYHTVRLSAPMGIDNYKEK